MKTRAELRDLIWRLTVKLTESIPPRDADLETTYLVAEGYAEGRHTDVPECGIVSIVHDEPDGIQ